MQMLIKGLIIAIVIAALDQFSKFYIFGKLLQIDSRTIEVLPFFNLVVVRNYGVSFGMFNDLSYGSLILSIVALSIVCVLCIWLYRVTQMYMAVALGLIIGGAIGNITDRIRVGAVADFLDFHAFGYHWPAFNVADIAVFIGVFIMILDSFKEGKKNVK